MSIIKARRFPFGSPVHGTKLSRFAEINNVPAPEKVYISLSQHIGAPALPAVSPGDKVKKGQLIGRAAGTVSANIYSSVCGTVSEVTDLVNGLGQKQTYVIIENDGGTDEIRFEKISDLSPQSVIERIALAGIVGLGGAGFPTAVKLSPKTQLEVLVINGAECEPYLTCDDRLMLEKTEEIYQGIKIMAGAIGVTRIVMGIELNKPLAIEAFSKYEDIGVAPLKKQYPMGSEKHLIYSTTGKKVPPGKMPFDVGACVQNVKTALAVYEAVALNKPLTETVLTVSGRGVKTPKNLRVPLGTPYSYLIDYCGGTVGNTAKLICGGPMMGKALISGEHYTRKTDSGILVLTDGETDSKAPSNCINCARCADKCPMRLMPMKIERCALENDFAGAEKLGAMNCIECGLCAYNCPAKRALVQSIVTAKQKIREMKKNG